MNRRSVGSSSSSSTLKPSKINIIARRPMGAIHKMATTLGDSPAARALRGNFSSQRSLPHLAKHFFFGFLFLLRAKKASCQPKSFGSTPLVITMLVFAFTGQNDQRKVRENRKYWVCWQLVVVKRRLTQVFRKDRTDFDACRDTTIARVPVCFQPPGRLPFHQLWWSSDGELNVSCSFLCLWFLPMYTWHCNV